MYHVKKTLFHKHKGFTLVEVLASIVILMIIMTSILMILAQSAKTNKVSEDIIDATYIAQTEMEAIYGMSVKNTSFVSDTNYEQKPDNDGWEVYHKAIEDEPNHFIEVRTQETTDDMIRVVVRIYDKLDESKPKAQMENLLKWGAE